MNECCVYLYSAITWLARQKYGFKRLCSLMKAKSFSFVLLTSQNQSLSFFNSIECAHLTQSAIIFYEVNLYERTKYTKRERNAFCPR